MDAREVLRYQPWVAVQKTPGPWTMKKAFSQIWPVAALAAPAIVLIWIVVPYNNFLLHNGYIADDYLLPVAVLFYLVILLGVLPLLRRFSLRFALSGKQLASLFALLMLGSLATSGGLLRQFPHSIAMAVEQVNTDERVADAYEQLDAPPSLFPDRLGFGEPLPVIEPFMSRLAPGENIPWRPWARTFFSWSGFILPWWLMMVAMVVIFHAYWRDVERVPYPLVKVMQTLADVPEGGRLPRVLKSGRFWLCFGAVFVIHALNQGHGYWPDRVPDFPIQWQLAGAYSENPWRYFPSWMKQGTLYFSFLGIAFFAPARISMSIWFFQVVYAFYVMIGTAYMPPFEWSTVESHRIAAFITYPVLALWLARRHLRHVVRVTFRGPGTDEDRIYRWALIAFLGGAGAMIGWLLWVHVSLPWALFITIMGVLFPLSLMRMVAETGIPLLFPDTNYIQILVRLTPFGWRSAASAYFSGVAASWFGSSQRIAIGVGVDQALALRSDHGVRQHGRMALVAMAILALTIVGCGAVHLYMTYTNDARLDGGPIGWWGRWQLGSATWLLDQTLNGSGRLVLADYLPHLAFGSALTVALYTLCQTIPGWLIHPVGLLCVGTWSAHQIFPNFFLGWLAKILILRYGGARLHKRARLLFLGLILGEIGALIFWSLFAAVRAILGMDYQIVDIMPI